MNNVSFEQLFDLFKEKKIEELKSRKTENNTIRNYIIDIFLRILISKYGEGDTPDELYTLRQHILICLCYKSLHYLNNKMVKIKDYNYYKIDENMFILFRNSLDVLLKLGMGYRVQNTISMRRPKSFAEFQKFDNFDDKIEKPVSSLEYMGDGKFMIFYKYDKVSIRKYHSVSGLTDIENKYMVLYLFLSRYVGKKYVFSKYDGTQLDSDISDEISTFVNELTLLPKRRQHEFRNYFLNKVGVEGNYNSDYLAKAGVIARNELETIKSDYLPWIRYFHTKYKNFEIDESQLTECDDPSKIVKELYETALSYCNATYLDQTIYPNLVNINSSCLKFDYTQPRQEKTTQKKDECDMEFQKKFEELEYSDLEDGHRRIYQGYIGIDASKNGISITIFNPKKKEFDGDQPFQDGFFTVAYWSQKDLDKIDESNPNFTFQYFVLDKEEEETNFDNIVKFLNNVGEGKYMCCIERPLEGRNIDSEQSQFTIRLKQYIKNSGIDIFESAGLVYIRNNWYDLVSGINCEANTENNTDKIKYKNWCVYNELRFPDLFDSNIEQPSKIKKTSSHPVSDIIDSIIISHWLYKLDKYRSKHTAYEQCKNKKHNLKIEENIPFNGIICDKKHSREASLYVALFATKNEFLTTEFEKINNKKEDNYLLKEKLCKLSKILQNSDIPPLNIKEFINIEDNKNLETYINDLFYKLKIKSNTVVENIKGLYKHKWKEIKHSKKITSPLYNINTTQIPHGSDIQELLKYKIKEGSYDKYKAITKVTCLEDSKFLIINIPYFNYTRKRRCKINDKIVLPSKKIMQLNSIIIEENDEYSTVIKSDETWYHHQFKPSSKFIRRLGGSMSMMRHLAKYQPLLYFYSELQ